MYAPESKVISYCRECWWSDRWNPLDFGQKYDFEKPFFEQFGDLFRKVPLQALSNINSVNSDYANFVSDNKNCYLVFGTGFCENVAYARAWKSRDSEDCYILHESELCYECVNCSGSYHLLFCTNCETCRDSYFLLNCRNCSDCFGCANLVGKSHCLFNEQYSKEEYEKKLKEFDLENRSSLSRIAARVQDEIFDKAIRRYGNIIASVNCTGDNIYNSKNARFCFDLMGNVEDAKFIGWSADLKESYDSMGQWKNNFGYENIDSNVGQNNLGTITVYASSDCRYSHSCHGCEHCFGCIGLRQKSYCILNTQYSKEEYETLAPKIEEYVRIHPYVGSAGRQYGYGEFLPTEISPFAYNETIAQEYFPLTSDEAKKAGYLWKNLAEKNYSATLLPEKLPENIRGVDDGILKEIIMCEHDGKCSEQCATAFRIIPQELQFYRRMNLPLPRLCPNCRHYQRLRRRNPLNLWHGKCGCAGLGSENAVYKNTAGHFHGSGHCPNEFETPYTPDLPRTVYCEQCYQAEVA